LGRGLCPLAPSLGKTSSELETVKKWIVSQESSLQKRPGKPVSATNLG